MKNFILPFVLLSLLSLGFKYFDLKNFNFFPAKVTKIILRERKDPMDPGVVLKIGFPEIEYIKDGEKIIYSDEKWAFFNFLNENDKLTILENKLDKKDIQLFTISQYWFPLSQIILIALISFISYGYFRVFGK